MNLATQGRKRKQRGTALVTTFGVMALLTIAAVAFIDNSTQTMRNAVHNEREAQATNLCEAGVQAVLRTLWRPFKAGQSFDDMETDCACASSTAPKATSSGAIDGIGSYAAGVIGFYSPGGDPYSRIVKVRAVGWIDKNSNGAIDRGEPSKTVDVVAVFELRRSQVFDYTYFVNNYGWFSGFTQNTLVANGDIRANGNMDFSSGLPVVNGSIGACVNDKLTPAAPGLINAAPVKWTDSTYKSNYNSGSTPFRTRWRQAYDPAIHGAIGSEEFEKWRDLVFCSNAQIVGDHAFGAGMLDASGVRGWQRTGSSSPTYSLLDTTPTSEVIMPDLNDLSYYMVASQRYVDNKTTYDDGTANPYAGQGSYVEVWNATTNQYDRLSTNGVVSGSAVLVGTTTHPIRLHGPVTVSQDVVIKGSVSGQGSLYAGRNVHVVGSITYSNPPDFTGTDMNAIEQRNEKRDFLGLAARASVIMGNPVKFSSSTLGYMTPPFTHGRYDENGNYVSPFNAKERDSTGRMKYQSVVADSTISAIASGVNQIDAILYTNFVGGGDVGTSGSGCAINGSIISKDEAIVAWSTPLRFNYDTRIRERGLGKTPLIDLQLPRSPSMLRSTWQDRGFSMNN